MDVPNEVWTNIFKFCDVPSLFNLMQTCKRLNNCSNTDIVWACQWQKLMVKHQTLVPGTFYLYNNNASNATLSSYHYKDMCKRFVKIFGIKDKLDPINILPLPHGTEYLCCKCKGVLCNKDCIENNDELIIFDFGSKTTWFKYESENTGQLSMHPTVAPITDMSATDMTSGAVNDDPLLTDSCPVCTKIIKKRLASITHNVTSHKDKKRLISAFTKLSLRGLHCFESSQLDTDETEYTAAVLSPTVLSSCDINALSRSQTCNPEGNSEQENKSQGDGNKSLSDLSCLAQVEPLLFLMTHMLKRSAFLPGKNIPFVICEPLEFRNNMKRDLVRYVFEELKVPGVSFVPKPVAVSLYVGLDTCLVVDSGANNTVVTPVVNQQSIQSSCQWKPIGGRHISVHLKECLHMKGIDFEVDDASLDSSQVKRECWLAYNPDIESKKKITSRNITVKGHRGSETDHFQVALSHELYLAVENMYLNLELASMIKASTAQFDAQVQAKLLSNIVLSGGNCRLNGLSNRLTKDLQEFLPQHTNRIRVCDPRLMTGRTDVVVGASYIKRLDNVSWITRQDYVCHGLDVLQEISC